jgi:hypothetical protein
MTTVTAKATSKSTLLNQPGTFRLTLLQWTISRLHVPTMMVKAVIIGVQLRMSPDMSLAQGATKKNSMIIIAPIKKVTSRGKTFFSNVIPPISRSGY